MRSRRSSMGHALSAFLEGNTNWRTTQPELLSLLSAGANPNAWDRRGGVSVFSLALKMDDRVLVEKLLGAGVNIRAAWNTRSPSQAALLSFQAVPSEPLALLLFEWGLPLKGEGVDPAVWPLVEAAGRGWVGLLERALELHPDAWPPGGLAKLACTKLLTIPVAEEVVRHVGPSELVQIWHGAPALHWAVCFESAVLAERLIGLGAPLLQRDEEGRSALDQMRRSDMGVTRGQDPDSVMMGVLSRLQEAELLASLPAAQGAVPRRTRM